ncbi:MAG: M56 family metallopeptidase [Lachnospiraceae bacterium]|nr:M56 family metallopeptidase [Lachnospiraceae bacterium]
MNTVLKLFLSMSFSGAVLILILLIGTHLLKDKLSRQWQYYIWLIVILRLLLPFGTEINLLGKTYQTIDQTITQTAPLSQQQTASDNSKEDYKPDAGFDYDNEKTDYSANGAEIKHKFASIITLLANYIWLIWLAGVLGMLIRKITIYQSYIRYIKAGASPVSDIALLDKLSIIAEQINIQKPVELSVNPLVSSPLLTGLFRPCIVLPSADIPEKDFRYIVLHELMHYKRRDILYKWLVQAAVCLHWFNPFVYLMSRKIAKACEFSCDEAVLAKTGSSSAQDYGKTLLDAMAAVGTYKETFGAVTLSENKQLLKERLGAIMNYRKKSKTVRLLTGVLTMCIMLAAFCIGVYPIVSIAAPSADKPSRVPTDSNAKDTLAGQAQRFYEAGSLPLFEIAFSGMDENVQSAWLERIYDDNEIAFFSVSINHLDEDSPVIGNLAEKLYQDGAVSFFSVLADCMGQETLELWLDRALEDGNPPFQSVMYNKLGQYDEWDELEQELEKKQLEQYQAVGVTKNGKNYYYQGQRVNIFLDIRPNKSFYTLDMNPTGTVNIRILRGEDGQITGVAYMTEEEVTELLGDMDDPDDDQSQKQKTTIPVEIDSIEAGESVWLGTYTLDEDDRVSYHISAETGQKLVVGFIKPGQEQKRSITYYNTYVNTVQDGVLEIHSDDFVWSVKSGEYRLFVRAEGGALTGVTGEVTIIKSAP